MNISVSTGLYYKSPFVDGLDIIEKIRMARRRVIFETIVNEHAA